MNVTLGFSGTTINLPYLHQTRDGQSFYRRPYPKGKGAKTASRFKQVHLPVTAPESLALLHSLLADFDDIGFLDQDDSDYVVANIVKRLPEDLWTRIEQTPMPEFAEDLLVYFMPVQFELALLRMTAAAHIAPSWDHYLDLQRAALHSMQARHIEAVLQLGLYNDDAQALYDQFLEETGEEDQRPKRP